jgi:hypothetical protein
MAVNYDRLNAACRDKHGTVISYTPAGGNPRNITAIIDQVYYSDTGGVGIQTHRVTLHLVAGDVPELAAGDVFTILGVDHVAVEIQPDFFGMLEAVIQVS